MDKYFAYTNDLGIEFFETEEEAIQWCNDEIQHYREQAGLDEWSDEVGSIQYGKILGGACELIIDAEHSDYEMKVYD